SADVLLVLGDRLDETTTLGYTFPAPGSALVQVDASPDLLGQSFPARIAIAADAGETISAFLAAAREPGALWNGDRRSVRPDRSAANRRERARSAAGTTP